MPCRDSLVLFPVKSRELQENKQMKPRLEILFVPRWYPSRVDPMPGLFIQRQAESLAKLHSVKVISVHPDPDCPGNFEIARSKENEVDVCRVYYRPGRGYGILSKLAGAFRYVMAHHRGYMSLMPFRADLVHGHILTREIWFAAYMAGKQKCRFLISEHWSRYFPGNGTYRGMFRKLLTKRLVKRSAALLCVSETLKGAMKECSLSHPQTYIVPNIVDMKEFIPSLEIPERQEPLILHVSCFEDKSKNISGFLEALAVLSLQGRKFRAVLVGEGPDLVAMKELASRLGFEEGIVSFAGLKQGKELVEMFQKASFLVQTSRYETFGTVIVEALACGIPVVSTRTGIAAELIGEDNGYLIKQPVVNEIVAAIGQMIDNYSNFDRNKLHASVADRFSEEYIAELLTHIYHSTTS